MKYKFAIEKINYEDYASGRVLFNQQGVTSFPVRLASEIFQLCADILTGQGIEKPYTLYDPCCGGAYLLTTLGYLHGNEIKKIYASDVDSDVITLAKRNLALLSTDGINKRVKQISKMIDEYGKTSHLDALKSASKLKSILDKRNFTIKTHIFNADITKDNLTEEISSVNMVITDLPYGKLVNWKQKQVEDNAIEKFLENILSILTVNSVVGIVSTKKTKIDHDRYKRIKRFSLGKRQVTIMQPIVKTI